MSATATYTLEITVLRILPRFWRHILVPSDIRLSRLHTVIQNATDAPRAVQRFFIDGQKRIFGNPTWKDFPKIRSDSRITLDRLLRTSGDTIAYFSGESDQWEHVIKLLKITNRARRLKRATCVAGSRDGHSREKHVCVPFRRSAVNDSLRHVRV